MNYPVLQVNKNGQATTSVFRGINRLPEGAEGEGAEFCNLSLDLYPAASTAGLSETNETVYIKNSEGADEAIDLSLLQAVADITDKDGVLYLTGVYNGEFYYEGNVAEYYLVDDSRKITPADKVRIEKIGKTYVIITIKEDGKSFMLSFNTDIVATTQPELRKVQNKLTSEVLKYRLPTESFDELYIYKMVVEDMYIPAFTKLQRIEMTTGKQYYNMYMRHMGLADPSAKKTFPKHADELKVYDKYRSLYGIGVKLTSNIDDFDKEYYCFDDCDIEHPVKFVIDYVGNAYSGTNKISDFLQIEKDAFPFNDWTWLDAGYNFGEDATPYHIDKTRKQAVARDIYRLDGAGYSSGPYTPWWHIVGHFEKWDSKKQRYEFYTEEDGGAIWRRIDENGNELTPTNYGDVMDVNNHMTCTIIPVQCEGVETEGVKLSHMTAYKGRIFAAVNDGSMLVASELGSYTDFGEFQGISTDSGYFNSLTAGKYTGISEYQGTLVVFKADRMSIYYGDTPSDMVLSHEIKNVGCIDADSIKECAGMLIFLGKGGFYAYTGGQPQCISRKLAKEYKTAKAFVSGRKYYAEADGELLIYDTDTGAWTSSDITGIKDVCGERIFLSDGRIMKTEGNVDWSGEWVYESMDMFEDMTEDKGINEIYIRAKLQGKMTVKTITDGEMREHMTIEDDGERMKVWRVPVRFLHGNYYRIRLEGEGKCILYAVERKCYAGGKKR